MVWENIHVYQDGMLNILVYQDGMGKYTCLPRWYVKFVIFIVLGTIGYREI